jgi:hypothetical protein
VPAGPALGCPRAVTLDRDGKEDPVSVMADIPKRIVHAVLRPRSAMLPSKVM